MYTTNQIANMLGVTDTSVRRYTKDYREHLSEFTQRKRRQFTDRDVTILKAAQRFAGEGHTKVEINRLLFDTDLSTQDTGTALQSYGEVIASLTTLKSHMDQTTNQVKETIENQRANATRVNTWLLMLSVAVGILLILIIALLIRG